MAPQTVVGLVIAQQDRLARRVGHGIVRERGQTILAAVLEPCERGTGRRHERTEIGVGENVRPRRWRFLVAAEHHHVFAAVEAEAPDAVRHQQRHVDARIRPASSSRALWRQTAGDIGRGRRTIELMDQVTTTAAQHGFGGGLERSSVGGGQAVPSQQVDATWPVLPRGPGPALDQRGQLLLHLVEIAGRVLVHDHDVGTKRLQAPVFLRLQDLPDEPQVVGAGRAHQDDRQVS